MSCVNSVGINITHRVNRYWSYVSELVKKLTKILLPIVQKNGPFEDRKQLKSTTIREKKAYQQAAAFIRIRDGKIVGQLGCSPRSVSHCGKNGKRFRHQNQ